MSQHLIRNSTCILQWQDMLRESVREKATDATMREAFRRIIPFPCKEKYTAVVLMPKVSRLPKLLNTLVGPEGKLKTRDSKVGLNLNIHFNQSCLYFIHYSPTQNASDQRLMLSQMLIHILKVLISLTVVIQHLGNGIASSLE